MTIDRDDLRPVTTLIGRLFSVGIIASALILVVGLMMFLLGVSGARPVLAAGLIILMCIPAIRVVLAFADTLRRRDVALGVATFVVVLMLGWQLLFAGR